MARKPTKAEAKKKLASLPTIPGALGKLPGVPGLTSRVLRGAQGLAGLLIDIDPLNRTAESTNIPLSTPNVPPRSLPENDVIEMKRSEVITNMVNDPMIKLSPEMVDIVNDDRIMMSPNGQLMSAIDFGSSAMKLGIPVTNGKKKRKVSKYQKLLGKNLKLLKKKHPRTSITKLMKKAHLMTKRALK